jgi:CRP-like cAMP-binding protein
LSEAELAKFALLASLADAEREAIADEFELLELEPDSALFHEGEPADAALFIAAGRVRVHARAEAVEAEVGAGDVLGSLSLAVDGPREASAQTLSQARVWRLTRSAFRRLVEAEPVAACRLLEGILREYAAAVREEVSGDRHG